MKRQTSAVLAMLLLVSLSGVARAGGLEVSAEVSDGKASATAGSKVAGAGPLAHRAELQSAVNGAFTFKWKVVGAAKEESKDVLVHFYVVKLSHPGQAPPALAPGSVVLEGAMRMDFPQGDTASGTQPFRLTEPGVYLLRVEASRDTDEPASADAAELELVAK